MFETLGFIGLGLMGMPMSKRLLDAGYGVIGYDPDSAACKQAKVNGAEIADSPGEIARQCDLIITMLPNSAIVEAVVLGDNGLLPFIREGAVVIDMSSSYPMSTRRISEELGKKKAAMLDAPVSGGVTGANQGTLSIMVGGDDEVFARCRPVLDSLGKNLFHMGAVGAGHTMKAVNNFLSGCSVAATAEALAVAVKAGLAAKTVVDVLQVSTGRNYATEWKFPRHVLPRTFADGFRLELLDKDLDILTRLARELGVPAFTANTVSQLFGFAMAQGYGEEGHTSIVRLIEEWAGVEIRE